MIDVPGIVFLDRDGTLIETKVTEGGPVAQNDPSSFALLPNVREGCKALKRDGHQLVMVTNQPDVPRGRARLEDVTAINDALSELLDLDLVLMCLHDDADGCTCRKPLPGMLLEGADRLGRTLTRDSVMVGDRWRDVRAGENAGVTTVLIGDGYGESVHCNPDVKVASFPEAVRWIQSQRSRTT